MQQQLEIVVSFKDQTKAGTQSVKSGFTAVRNSVADLKARLQAAIVTQSKYKSSMAQWARATKVIAGLDAKLAQEQRNVAQAMVASNKVMQQSTRGSANMTMALQSMNFTVRDSPYFFRDFSLGILAVGNNLNPMIDSIIKVKQEMGGWKGAFKAFSQQMMGPAGIIMAFSLIVTAIQAITFAMAKNKGATDELGNSYDNLVSAADKYLTVIDPRKGLSASLSEAQSKKVIESLKQQIDELDAVDDMVADAQSRMTGNATYGILNWLGVGGRDKGSIDAITEALKKKVGVLESEAIIAKTLADLGIELTDEEKNKKDLREKQYIQTEDQMRQEIALLEVLRAQSQSILDRFHYTEKIESLNYRLGEMGRMVDPSEGLGYTPYTAPGSLKGVESVKNISPELKSANKQLQTSDMLATRVGTSLYKAFLQGKLAIDELLTSLLAVAAQLVIIEGLKYIFSGGISGLFGGLSQGGVVKASGGYMTGGNGSHDYIPAMLRPREMVLNPNQQAELFHMAKGIGYGGGGQNMNVKITGTTIEKKSQFVTKWRSAEKQYNDTRGINSVSRS